MWLVRQVGRTETLGPVRGWEGPQAATMRFDDRRFDWQPHAGALRLGSKKCIEDLFRLSGCSPMAVSLTEINSRPLYSYAMVVVTHFQCCPYDRNI